MLAVSRRPADVVSTPESYATPEQSRAYVAAVLARPKPDSRPRVYLIVHPGLRKNEPRWQKIAPAIHASLRGAELVGYREVFGKRQRPADERIAGISEKCHAAVVVPLAARWPGLPVRYLMGYPARLEAAELARAGMPVFVFTPAGMVAWPDVLVRPAAEPAPPPRLSQEVMMPEPSRMLPTVAACYQALGLEPPRRRRKQAG